MDNIRILREAFGVDVGVSDDTLEGEAALLSIHSGATMIEKHLIVSRGGWRRGQQVLSEQIITYGVDKKLSYDCSAVAPLV